MRVMDIPDKQKRNFAWETLDLYAPLSSRLGVDWMKRELEDLSFSFIYPEEYEALVSKIESSLEDRTAYVEEVKKILSGILTKNGITNFLLNNLVKIARELNYKSFSGSILVGNRAMLHIINNAGYPIISKSLDYGVVEFKFDITK